MQMIQSASSPETADLIRDFLQTHHSGTLATASAAGTPHAAAIYFSMDDDFSLVFATKTKTEKYENIKQNDRVAFVCYDEKTQTTVQVQGHIDEIKDADKRQSMINTIFRFSETISKTELPPIEKLFAGDYVVLRIVPQLIKMAVFLRPDSEGYDAYQTMTFASN